MWVLALQLLLAQSPAPVNQAVVVRFSRAQQYPKEKGLALAGRIAAILQYGGVRLALKPDEAEQALTSLGKSADACRGKKDCLAELGVPLHAGVVIAVEAGQVHSELAIHVEALAVDGTQRPLASDSFIVPESVGDTELQAKLGAFTRALMIQLQRSRASDAPLAQPPLNAGSTDARPPWQGVESAATRGRPTAVYVAGGVTAATGVAAGVLALVGLAQQGTYNSNTQPGQIGYTQSQAISAKNEINSLYTGALVTGIAAAALGAVTGVWWMQTSPPSE